MMPVKIMVADDNKLLLAMTKDALKEAGFEVTTVDSALEVYKRVLEEKPQMILLDIMMPGLDGIEICRTLKKSPVTRNIVIVIHSGKNDPALMDLCFEFGAEAFIIKSNNFDELVSRVQDVANDKLGD
jgi:CheY-like chemotaxis protein